jgi:hypothetical protein
MVTRLAQGQDQQRLGGMTGTGRETADAAFEVGDALLESIIRGIHDSRVYIASLFEGEQAAGMFGIFEGISCGLVNRNSAGAGGWVGSLPGVDLPGGETELV